MKVVMIVTKVNLSFVERESDEVIRELMNQKSEY